MLKKYILVYTFIKIKILIKISICKLKVLTLFYFKPINVIIFHDYKKFVLKKVSRLYAFSGYLLQT